LYRILMSARLQGVERIGGRIEHVKE
jgi:hypothetical protein